MGQREGLQERGGSTCDPPHYGSSDGDDKSRTEMQRHFLQGQLGIRPRYSTTRLVEQGSLGCRARRVFYIPVACLFTLRQRKRVVHIVGQLVPYRSTVHISGACIQLDPPHLQK